MIVDNSYFLSLIFLAGFGAWNVGVCLGKLIDKLKSKQQKVGSVE